MRFKLYRNDNSAFFFPRRLASHLLLPTLLGALNS